jgi:hypothetical protein
MDLNCGYDYAYHILMVYLLPLCLIVRCIYLYFISNQALIKIWPTFLVKPLHSYFPHTCRVRHVLTLGIYKQCRSERGSCYEVIAEDVLSSRRMQPPSRLLVEFGAFVSKIKHKSLISSFFLRDTVFVLTYMSLNICMIKDPSIHIVMHLVSFGKTGVTIIKPRNYL